jgi:hypothetical protein
MYATRMPYGKHRGWLLTDVPSGYLWWALEEWDWSGQPWLCRAVVAELRGRLAEWDHGGPAAAARAGAALPAGLLRDWFRGLALRYHPDRGGSAEAMVALNNARDLLKAALGRHGLPADF